MSIDFSQEEPAFAVFLAGYLAGSHCQPSWAEAVRQRGLGSITAQVLLLGARDCWREWKRLGAPGPEDCTTLWERIHE